MTRMLAASQFLTLIRVSAIIVSLVLGLAIIGNSGKGWSAEPEEAIPDENDHLTLRELRWCVFEDVRLEGESNEIDAYEGWEIDSYNARINQFNYRCLNKGYYEADETKIQGELTMAKRQFLEGQGALRIKKARVDRENRRVYVKDEEAIIRAAPKASAPELNRVPRWGELIKTGRVQGQWYEVEWKVPSLDNVLKFGWVIGGLLEGGSGSEARLRHCEEHVPKPRPGHNYVVDGRHYPDNGNDFSVENGLRDNAYVKLVRELDEAVISVLVEAGKTASLRGIPHGSYMVAFGTGSIFDVERKSFCIQGAAQMFDRRIDYDIHTAGWELTLQAVSGGNARTSSMSYDDFDKL